MRHDISQLTTLLRSDNFQPRSFIEIGSRDGHDTDYIRKYWNLQSQNCYIVEAHPQCYTNIINTYPELQVLNIAASDKTEVVSFNAGIFGREQNVGVSSILERAGDDFISERVSVDGWRMEEVMDHLLIDKFDFMKVDVEGFALQVLKGFGDKILSAKYLQVELETIEIWLGQSYYSGVVSYLADRGFKIIDDIDLGGNVQRDVLFKNTNLI
jgi:FkbM family methyltransferase